MKPNSKTLQYQNIEFHKHTKWAWYLMKEINSMIIQGEDIY